MSRVTDGADLRHQRIADMLAFIERTETSGGATTLDIQTFMLVKYGLKHKTTSEYLHEVHVGGVITIEENTWHTTDRYKRLISLMYSR